MSKVKIIAVSDAKYTGQEWATGSPICTEPAYIGQTGETTGGLVVEGNAAHKILFHQVKIDDGTIWLFAPEQLQEVAE